MTVPGVGSVVHWVEDAPSVLEPPGTCRAAIVTRVHGRVPESAGASGGAWMVSLTVFHPTGMSFHELVAEEQTGKRRFTWHWPEPAEEHQSDVPRDEGEAER